MNDYDHRQRPLTGPTADLQRASGEGPIDGGSSMFKFWGRINERQIHSATRLVAHILSLVFVVLWVAAGPFRALWNPPAPFGPDARVEIVNHQDQRGTNSVAILGSFTNRGETVWSSPVFKVEFYDKDKVFIDECFSTLENPTGPGQTQNFKVVCTERPDQFPIGDSQTRNRSFLEKGTLQSYGSYTVTITNAQRREFPFF